MEKREWRLDAIKGIAMILVVFCHFPCVQTTVTANVLMAMAHAGAPLFFTVSGGLFHLQSSFSWKKHLKKLAYTYFKLCIWKLIYLGFYWMFSDVSINGYGELFNYIFLFGEIENVKTGVMWFMNAYLMALLLGPITYTLFWSEKNTCLVYLMAILFGGSIFITSTNFVLAFIARIMGTDAIVINAINTINPFGAVLYGNYQEMLFYFILGAFLFKYKEQIQRKLKWYFCPVIIVIGTVGLVLIKFWYDMTFVWNGVYMIEGYYRISTILLSVGIFWLIYNSPDNRVLKFMAQYVGTATMGIYFLHFPMLDMFFAYSKDWIVNYLSVTLGLIKTLVVIAVCVVLTRAIRKIPFAKSLVS